MTRNGQETQAQLLPRCRAGSPDPAAQRGRKNQHHRRDVGIPPYIRYCYQNIKNNGYKRIKAVYLAKIVF